MTTVAPPAAPPRSNDAEALMKEARERQQQRRQRLALVLLLLASLGGIGYGIDRGVSGGRAAPACAGNACSGAGVTARASAPIIASVLAEPDDLRLSSRPAKIVPGKPSRGLTVVPAPRGLAFKVTLRNPSTSSDTNVSVRLIVYRTLAPPPGTNISTARPHYRPTIVETQQTGTLNPGGTAAVTFGGHLLVPFAEATKISVEVAAVTSGKPAVKRVVDYPVIFSLP